MSEVAHKRYVVIDKVTQAVAVDGFKTRQAARNAKRELEYKNATADGTYSPKPSRYFVETDVDHPNGAGIYLH